MYALSSGASTFIFWMMVILVPTILIIMGLAKMIQNSNDEAKADAYIKRVMGEGEKRKNGE